MFLATFKLDFFHHRRQLVQVFFATFIIELLAQVLLTATWKLSYPEAANSPLDSSLKILTVLIILIGMLAGASLLFGNVEKRQQRIAFLMLPVARRTKFLVRYLFVTLLWAAVLIAAIALADGVRLLFQPLYTTYSFGSVLPQVWELFTNFLTQLSHIGGDTDSGLTGLTTLSNFIQILYIHSFYLLGSVLFRRRSWILTTLFLLAWTFLVVQLNLDEHLTPRFYSAEASFYFDSGINFLLVLLNLAITYRLYTRMQVISRL